MSATLKHKSGMLMNPTLAGMALLAGLASMSSCGEVRDGFLIISNHEEVVDGPWSPEIERQNKAPEAVAAGSAAQSNATP